MTYKRIHKARSHHPTRKPDGTQSTRYSPYEIGMISGAHRDLMAIVADSAGFDGLSFDTSVGSNDDSWHVFSVFDDGRYVDSVVIGGALDNSHALTIARTQLDHLGGNGCVMVTGSETQFDAMSNGTDDTWSIDSINKLMSNQSQDKPYLPLITASELNHEAKRACFDSVQWDNDAGLISHGGKISSLQLDMTRADSRHELVSKFDLVGELASLGVTLLDEGSFDALMETKNRLDLLKTRLFNALKRASDTDSLKVKSVTETKPFKRQGVSNIAIVFDLSDGQTISIWFHNPDSTPNKLLPSDIMISWKWMLNKRDVTAVLSPKQGDNVQLPVLARRILLVASKNSKRFQATQARKIKEEKELLDAQNELNGKDAIIAQLDTDIAELNAKIDEAMKAPKVASVVEPVTEPVIETSVVDETVAEPANQEVDADDTILELKGNELGEFEDTPEGKKQLRAAAKDEFNKLRGQWIDCPSLSATEGENAKIEIRKRGIKEFMAFSGDSRKLKLVAKIAEIIRTATLSANSWQDNEKLDKKPMVAGYYHLENKISIDGEIVKLRVLIEKDQKGLLHYDVILPKHEASFDNLEQKNVLETAIPDNDSGVASSTLNIKSPNDEDVNQDQAMFDKASPATVDGVLNMFILNETSTEDTAGGNDSIEAEGTDKELADTDGDEASTTNPNNKKITKGKSNKAKTSKGTKIESVFALVDAKFLIASHTANGSKNPKYPQELQPRDRARESSIAWVQKTSKELDPESLGRTGRVDTGAPIVGDDLVVESGNGRTIAIKMAYANGDAGEYREWLAENADMFGMTAKQVESYKQPILVRVRTTDVNRSEFAVEANQDDKLSFTASERAKSDAKRVNAGMLELFDPSESGDILAASNRDFVKSFLASLGATEAAQYTDSNGNPTQALVARIKGALFSKAYDDDRLLEMMADQTKPDLQNTLNALTMAAPNFVAAQSVNRSDAQDLAEKVVDSVEQSLSDEVKNAIVDATNMIMNAKISNQDIKEYVLQQGLFEQVDDSVAELAVFLAANARSAKKMTDYFNAMASYIEQDSVSRQNLDMFGEPEPLSLADVIAHANSKASENTDTIGSLDMFKETAVDETVESAPQDSNPIDDINSADLAAKVDSIVKEINSSNFDPEVFDSDELANLLDQVEGDEVLTGRITAVIDVYQDKLIAVSLQALTNLKGDQ